MPAFAIREGSSEIGICGGNFNGTGSSERHRFQLHSASAGRISSEVGSSIKIDVEDCPYDLDWERTGCKVSCQCAMLEHCYPKLKMLQYAKRRRTVANDRLSLKFHDVGICDVGVTTLIVISVVIIVFVIFFIAIIRSVLLHIERVRDARTPCITSYNDNNVNPNKLSKSKNSYKRASGIKKENNTESDDKDYHNSEREGEGTGKLHIEGNSEGNTDTNAKDDTKCKSEEIGMADDEDKQGHVPAVLAF